MKKNVNVKYTKTFCNICSSGVAKRVTSGTYKAGGSGFESGRKATGSTYGFNLFSFSVR